jgi:hypothetical protein
MLLVTSAGCLPSVASSLPLRCSFAIRTSEVAPPAHLSLVVNLERGPHPLGARNLVVGHAHHDRTPMIGPPLCELRLVGRPLLSATVVGVVADTGDAAIAQALDAGAGSAHRAID